MALSPNDFSRDSLSGSRNSRAGTIATESVCPTERWVLGSNHRMLSTSSPRNSMRAGRSLLGENISTIPPRLLMVPGVSTISPTSYPISANRAMRRFRSMCIPLFTT
ncbi:MAG: hypothetical protein DDT26_02349 [Dehalococcoidia bacterium]|nr:hypothetical protein [Chloroflexota bacterium]